MDKSKEIESLVPSQEKVDLWFTQFIDELRVDHLLISTNTASDELKQRYSAFINQDAEALGKMVVDFRKMGTMHLIKGLVFEYLKELNSEGITAKLALGLSDSKIFVWAEIDDQDNKTEDILLLAEAKVNEKYLPYGLYITTTIVEKSEEVPIPPHYQLYPWQTSQTT